MQRRTPNIVLRTCPNPGLRREFYHNFPPPPLLDSLLPPQGLVLEERRSDSLPPICANPSSCSPYRSSGAIAEAYPHSFFPPLLAFTSPPFFLHRDLESFPLVLKGPILEVLCLAVGVLVSRNLHTIPFPLFSSWYPLPPSCDTSCN